MGVFRNWPYTNFHDLNLDWITAKFKQWQDTFDNLNQVITDIVNNALDEMNLPQMIDDAVEAALNERQLVVNIKYPPAGVTPARGDGADDTATFQGCIDYLAGNGGGLLFVPDGRWMSHELTIKNGVYVMGASPTTTITLIGGSDTPLFSGSVTDCGWYNISLNGNGSFQTAPENVIQVQGNIVLIDNVNLSGGDYGANISVDEHAFVSNVNITMMASGGLAMEGNGYVICRNVDISNISSVTGVAAISNNADNAVYDTVDINSNIPTGVYNTGDYVRFSGAIVGCNTAFDNTGDYLEIEAHVTGAATVIEDAGTGTSYRFTGQSSQRKIGDALFNIGTAEPVMYRSPEEINKYFNKIPMQSFDGEQYDVLVGTNNTEDLYEYIDNYEIVNVADYNPTKDGTAHMLSERYDTLEAAQQRYPVATALTDYIDWCAIQQAINDAQAKHKNVFIPGGDYLMNTFITVDNSNGLVSVFGEGLTETKINVAGTALYIKGSTTPALYRTFQTFKGFLLNCDGTMSGRGIQIEQCAYLLIDTVLTHGFESGIYMLGCEHSRFVRFQAEACGTGVTGPELNLGTYTAPNNLLFESCIIGGNLYAVNVQQGADITFINCSIENNSEYGVGLSGLCYQGGVGANFIGCYFENNKGLGHIIIQRQTNKINTACALNVIGCSFNFTEGTNFGAVSYTGVSADLDYINVLGCGFNKFSGYTEGTAPVINPSQTSYWRYGNKSNMTAQGANINDNAPVTGDVRYTTKLEYYTGTSWADVPTI